MKRCRAALSTPFVLHRSCELLFVIRAARVLTFGDRETVEFTMGDEEWKAWEMALLRNVAIVDHEGRSVTNTLDMLAFDICQAEHT
jgi:hypothetical protein